MVAKKNKTTELFERVEKLTEQDQIALLFRLWGYLESDTPKFIEGLEIFVTQLEKRVK